MVTLPVQGYVVVKPFVLTDGWRRLGGLVPSCVTVIMTALCLVEKSVSVRQSTGSVIPEHLMSVSHGICVLVAPVINCKQKCR